MKSYFVVGLGRFGASVATHLCELGNEVLVMDTDSEIIQKISPFVTTAICGDARDIDVLRSIGAKDFDCAVVSMGSDLAASILITLNLKELGVPAVICKARDITEMRALEKIGADRVIIPEREMGAKIAQQLTSANVLDFIELSKDYGIAEVTAPAAWVGKNLIELNIRSKFGLNIIAIKRENDTVVSPKADFVLLEKDIIVVLGRTADISGVENI